MMPFWSQCSEVRRHGRRSVAVTFAIQLKYYAILVPASKEFCINLYKQTIVYATAMQGGASAKWYQQVHGRHY